MHVLIDARMAVSQNFGFGRYVHNLLREFKDLAPDHRFTLLVNDDFPAEVIANAPNIVLCRVNIKWLSIAEQIKLPLVIKRVSPDVYFCPTFITPVVQTCPTVIAIHDLMHVIFSRHYSWVHRIYYGWWLRLAAKKAKSIITTSESSKQDLIRYYGLSSQKISVIHDGVEPKFRLINDKKQIDSFKSKHKLPEHFILYVGARKINKNIDGILAAYALYSQKNAKQLPLVLTGEMDKKLSKLVKKYGISEKVICVGAITDAELPLLYNSAALFLSPSLYEGFGLPHLEAMACGIPVIASNVSSLPEIMGEGGLLVDPKNSNAIARAIEKVLSDRHLGKELISRGLEKAKHYSWKTCARKTLEVLR